jgi:hypothetical protein
MSYLITPVWFPFSPAPNKRGPKPKPRGTSDEENAKLKDQMEASMQKAIQDVKDKVSVTKAAQAHGVSVHTLRTRIKKLGLTSARKTDEKPASPKKAARKPKEGAPDEIQEKASLKHPREEKEEESGSGEETSSNESSKRTKRSSSNDEPLADPEDSGEEAPEKVDAKDGSESEAPEQVDVKDASKSESPVQNVSTCSPVKENASKSSEKDEDEIPSPTACKDNNEVDNDEHDSQLSCSNREGPLENLKISMSPSKSICVSIKSSPKKVQNDSELKELVDF